MFDFEAEPATDPFSRTGELRSDVYRAKKLAVELWAEEWWEDELIMAMSNVDQFVKENWQVTLALAQHIYERDAICFFDNATGLTSAQREDLNQKQNISEEVGIYGLPGRFGER